MKQGLKLMSELDIARQKKCLSGWEDRSCDKTATGLLEETAGKPLQRGTHRVLQM